MLPITFYRGTSFVGKKVATRSGEVCFVDAITPSDITYRPLAADYSTGASKKFYVTATRRRYGSLEAAAAAAVKARPQASAA